VIILDIRLPDTSGLEILREITAHDSDVKVIMITAYHDMETTIEAMRYGAYDYIHKPLDVDELDHAVKRGLHIAEASLRTPPQELFLLGGQGTLPGYDYRSFVGRRFWVARVEGTHPLRPPWVGIRAFAALGSTHLAGAPVPAGWDAAGSGGVRASVGAGLALGWDVLRLDLARGLRDGRWEVMFSADSRFHPWL
jgi:CheY-like chemotaxis protein